MSQYTSNDNNNCFNYTNSFNNVWNNNYSVADDRPQLLTWLSPLEPSLRHRDIRERRVNNVGEWLVQSAEFRKWCWSSGEDRDDSPVLFCHGDPGVGKTFISSLVVDRLCDLARGHNTAVTCFYFDFAARKEQSATNMLGSLLKQMVSGMERIPGEILRAFQEQKLAIGGCGPQLVDIVKMLQDVASSQPTFMCIDALDECVGVQRVRVLDSLKHILEKSPTTRIFVTGRPNIRAEMEKRFSGRMISVSICPTKADIIGYLRVKLGEDETPDAMNEILEAEILEKIPENISQMFLLASLNIEAILKESTIYRRRERLRKIMGGLGLGDAYGATIERIMAQGGDKPRLGMGALMWISHAERPLRTDELCHALAIELDSEDFNPDNVPSMSTLVGCCQGLITVDEEASTVRLIHFTLQEYISTSPDILSSPHSIMAETCLTYLNSEQVKAIPADCSLKTLNMPFLKYCSLYWGVHAKRQLSDCSKSLALQLLQKYDGHISIKYLFQGTGYLYLPWRNTSLPFSGLHWASFFGVVGVVAALIKMGCYDIDARDYFGHTPLAWASRNGHEEVVKILLERGDVNPNKDDDLGRTPLFLATYHGHEEVVKVLLGRDEVKPDQPSTWGQTPLSRAAECGHEGVVKILIGREDVNPHRPDDLGTTPFAYAAQRGHKEVVKILLGYQGVDPDNADTWDTTLLWHAAAGGDVGAAEILLGREGTDPDKSDHDGRTMLSHAASKGHEGIVKILLSRQEVNPSKPDNYGKTPLLYATWYGQEGAVRILLGREEVNPDHLTPWGRTPLSYAAEYGHEKVVKILLGLKEVTPDKPDDQGKTPFSYAAEYGHEEVVKILLGSKGVTPDKPDYRGRTPLSYAAKYSREEMVKILLGLKEVTPDKPDDQGRTPLSYAAGYEREEVVKILLRRKEVTPDKPDNQGRTPLSHAAGYGHQELVKILLGRKEVTPDKPDNQGKTPLLYAAGYGHQEVVKMLLERKEVTPHRPDHQGKTPLMCAVRRGHKKVIALL